MVAAAHYTTPSPIAATPGRGATSLAARRPGPVVLVATSCAALGDTALPTGASLPDLAVLYTTLVDAGIDTEIVSVGGGPVPLDPASLAGGAGAALKVTGPALRRLAGDAAAQRELADTRSFIGLGTGEDLAGLVFVGGRGAAWDLAYNPEAAALAASVHAAGGVVAGIGHGAAALVSLARGRAMTGFSNAEEDADGGAALVPTLLESRLKKAGAKITTATVPGAAHAVRDGRVVTGQNCASAPAVAGLVLEALSGGVAGLGVASA
jgi:putative intracellular protease/amidase